MCKMVCTKYWDINKVIKFGDLIAKDYGYRLFVDDLPSATVQDGKTHYEWTVPLGFSLPPIVTAPTAYRRVGIYNHLEIKIKVHPTLKSDWLGESG